MTKINVGRNDPCPCGSGKKYKKCCMGREETGPLNAEAEDIFADLHQALEGHVFDSLEDAQVFCEGFIRQRNQAPADDFHGLSPEQMHRILNFPFTSPRLVNFPDHLETAPAAPILTLFSLLAEAIDEQGLKTTAKGNLPQKFCRDAALAFWGEETYLRNTRFCGINREEDFIELHVTRLVAGLSGLVRKYKGRFILSRDCRSLMAETGLSGVYPRLFRAYAERFNWAYWDRYPDIHFIQQSFLFTMYLLSRYGDDWRHQTFYEDCFLQAFPMVLNEVEPGPLFTPEENIRSCYTLRTLLRFAEFLGLAMVESLPSDKPYRREYRIKKSPLLDDAVRYANKP